MVTSLWREHWVKCTIAGFLVHIVLGTLYLWGIITVAVTSYLKKYDPSVTYNDTILIYGTALGVQGSIISSY